LTVLSAKTIERLSRCRTLLWELYAQGRQHIFSHEIAALINASPVQVRQDLMRVGSTGSPGKGYQVRELAETISAFLHGGETVRVVLAGAGSLGKAVLGYFAGTGAQMTVVAAFDTDPAKMDRVICGVRCYPLSRAGEIIRQTGATVGIIATPAEAAGEVKDVLLRAGISSLLNFSSRPLQVPGNIYVEEMDISVAMDKVIYFGKFSGSRNKV